MSRAIEAGDEVRIFWVDGSTIEGTVISAPAETGDLWYIKSKDAIRGINPNCSNFEMIVKTS